jgi:phospholipid/cholesterol/gamma-HCH transport system substrate-binding protein
MALLRRRSRHRTDKGTSPLAVGLVLVVLLTIGVYFAYTQANPFANPYEFSATFRSAQNLKSDAVVRIAGVNVGKVTKVEHVDRGAARVTMEIEEKGLPIKRDASLKIRPRIFLEGNLFVDLAPGSPSAEELPDGGEIGVAQTSTPVLFSDVLSILQSDVRSDLQTLLREYSSGLAGKGARGLNQTFRYGEDAYREAAIANEATLGIGEHDLSRLVRGQQQTAAGLARNEDALRDLVTNFNTFAGALAREDDALRAAIPALDEVLRVGQPALAALNGSLPSLRAFARDALPATISSGPALDANLPFIRQARGLMGERELKGLTSDLREAVPALVRLNAGQVEFLEQGRALSACTDNVVVPFARTPIPDPDFPANSGQPFYKQSSRGLVGLSGESRIYDTTSGLFHFQFGSGPYTIVQPGESGEKTVGTTAFPPLGVRPARPERRPDFRPNEPCEIQEPPNLNAVGGEASARVVNPRYAPSEADRELTNHLKRRWDIVQNWLRDKRAGRPTIDDPIQYTPQFLPVAARKQGLRLTDDNRFVPLPKPVKEEGRR